VKLVVQPSKRALAGRSSIIREILRLTQDGTVLSLAGGIPARDAIPLADLRAVAAGLPAEAFQYAPTEGHAPLRALLARHASAECGREVAESHVLVTSGSQQALDLIGRVLLDPGDLVAVEHPGYLGAIQALESHLPAFLPVPVDRHGLDVGFLADALASGARPKLVYTVPTFGNPTGATLVAERRAALAGLADRYGFVVVEDEPYRHLRYRGQPLPSLAASSERVIRLGTVSKTLAPGLRVGWAIGPVEIVQLLVRAKQAADLQASTLGQAVAAELLARPGWLEAQLERIVPLYRDRAEALAVALERELGHALELVRPDGGMFLWARLPGLDTTLLLQRAVDEGVAFVPGDAFAVPSGAPLSDALRLSFATLDPPTLAEAARRLRRAVIGS
jgi:2-aminoadipate transaminase